LPEPPAGQFDAVVAREGLDLAAIDATRRIVVGRDGSITERR
jgi:hypothetical protein